MTFWRTLSGGCWFSHEFIRDRDEQGRLILVCANCQHQHRPELEREALKGPAHTPVEGERQILGAHPRHGGRCILRV